MYDVIIIGAGPSGSHAAYRLAQSGGKVAVVEQKEAIGSQVCCTGIISRECYDLFCPGNNMVLKEAISAKFFVPSGRYVRLEKNAAQAYIVDRAAFDVALAQRAQETGVDYFLQSKVTDVILEGEGCQVEVSCHGRRQMFQAGAVVIACGFGSTLPQRLGMGAIANFIFGAQTEVNTTLDEVEVYFDQELAPGGFAWLVPTCNGRGLVGVVSRRSAYALLTSLLSRLIADGKISPSEFDIRQKAIPLTVLPRTYSDRVLVVGEAAGQVKPTTGGGIYFGLLCAELAAKVLSEAFLAGDLSSRRLSSYQKEWQTKIGSDLRISYWARKIYDKASHQQIERIFDIVASNQIHEQLLKWEDFSFDWHASLILRVLRQPKLLAGLVTLGFLFSTSGVSLLFQAVRSRVREGVTIAYGK